MTCASSSLHTFPASSHVTENPRFLAHIQIPVMCCLGTLVLGRLPSSFTHRIPFTTCIHPGKMWRRATRKAVPERRGIICRKLSGLGIEHQRCVRTYLGRSMLYEQAPYKVMESCSCSPGHVPIAFVRFHSPGVAPPLRFLRRAFTFLHASHASGNTPSSPEPDLRTGCEVAWASALPERCSTR